MCGIAGLYKFASCPDSADELAVGRMSYAMQSRGPDGSGYWSSDDGLVHLSHRRLAIIDLSATANQPMVDKNSGCTLTFNGEIYNYRQLRKELISCGHLFFSSSDTEVILKGYLHWGEELLQRLRGMFAFALWDPSKRALWMARDPYGIKPLYYNVKAGRLAFASQVKALRASRLDLDTSVDPAAVVGLMLMGSVPEPFSICRGISSLPAGHSLWVDKQGPKPSSPYVSVAEIWSLAAQKPQPLDGSTFRERVRNAVLDSVLAHQIADVPVGAFLSAGIDSASLLGLMSEAKETPVHSVTLGFARFKGTPWDEVQLAEQTSARYGASQYTVWVGDEEAITDLPRFLAAMDQPSVDGFNTWLVSKHAAALGLKVVLSGVGGDELFGGYSHFRSLPQWGRQLRRLQRLPGMLPLLDWGLRLARRVGLVHAKAAALARLGPDLAGLYLVRRGLFMPWELSELLDQDLVREGLAVLRPPHFLKDQSFPDSITEYAAIAAMEAQNYLRNQLLRDSDWASMDHSLELRTPLVDLNLLRNLAPVMVAPRPEGLPAKSALALAPRPCLSERVIQRSKSGFLLPIQDWLNQSELLDAWRSIPKLNNPGCHWARRMAYALAMDAIEGLRVP